MRIRNTFNAALLPCAAFFILSLPFPCSAQYRRTDTIPVTENSKLLSKAWGGGHNFCQFSDIDVNFDGKKDLFVFDRTGHKVSIYINKGTPNTIDYVDSTQKYAPKFPHLEDWALIRDYNCDGLPDIFTYGITVGGIKVWRNTSSGGNLQFTLQTNFIQSDYTPSNTTDPLSNLFISRVDLPSIDDIDGDGDLDILTFDISYIYLEWHVNKSKEMGYGCDSLIFDLSPGCWGHFNEDITGCNVYLGLSCKTTNYDSIFKIHKRLDDVYDSAKEAHAGNCNLCFDEDGDGDKEVLLGQLSCCNLVRLLNGGTPSSANMVSMDTLYPSYNVPGNFSTFPCGFFIDVNNDNKRDLIVAPNAPNVSINTGNIWYYENTGSDLAPVFSRKTRALFQEDMIETGEVADPVFFDFTGDGLTDLLITNYVMNHDSCNYTNAYGIRAYKNTGTASSPKFDFVTDDYANTSSQIPSLYGKHLAFGDLNGDGAADMMMGDFDGKLHYFQNTAGPSAPCNFVLTQQGYTDNNGNPIDVGNFSSPQIIDADRDGKPDMIIGERAGNLNYYHNIGTTASPSFQFVTDTLGGVDVLKPCCTGYSIPFLFDSAGSYRLLMGSEASRQYGNVMNWIWYYKNIDGNLGGKFTVVDSMYLGIWEGIRMAVNGSDINNDGLMDLVIGNSCGGVAVYMGDSTNVPVNEQIPPPPAFSIYPNPTPGEVTLHISNYDPSVRYEAVICNAIGETAARFPVKNADTKFSLHLGNGIYSCALQSSSGAQAIKKIIIVK